MNVTKEAQSTPWMRNLEGKRREEKRGTRFFLIWIVSLHNEEIVTYINM